VGVIKLLRNSNSSFFFISAQKSEKCILGKRYEDTTFLKVKMLHDLTSGPLLLTFSDVIWAHYPMLLNHPKANHLWGCDQVYGMKLSCIGGHCQNHSSQEVPTFRIPCVAGVNQPKNQSSLLIQHWRKLSSEIIDFPNLTSSDDQPYLQPPNHMSHRSLFPRKMQASVG
jgi:hypothetical protein